MKAIWIKFKDEAEYQRDKDAFYEVAYQYPGEIEVCFYFEAENKQKRLAMAINRAGVAVLRGWLGTDNIRTNDFELPPAVNSGDPLELIAFHLMEIEKTLKEMVRVIKTR